MGEISIEGERDQFVKGGRGLFSCPLREGGICSSREGGGRLLTHKLDVVGRKNNKFLCWEIQDST